MTTSTPEAIQFGIGLTMGGSRYHRQIGLFLITILLPAAVLAGLAVRMIHQERELAIKRAADRRHDALDQVHCELSARLEVIKQQEINRRIRAPASSPPENPAVVFTATLEGDRLVLPWEARSDQPAPESPEFARHRQDGEGAGVREARPSGRGCGVPPGAVGGAHAYRDRGGPPASGPRARQGR